MITTAIAKTYKDFPVRIEFLFYLYAVAIGKQEIDPAAITGLIPYRGILIPYRYGTGKCARRRSAHKLYTEEHIVIGVVPGRRRDNTHRCL